MTDITGLIVNTVLATSLLVAVLTAAIRFGLRPLLADWAALRAQIGPGGLERRMVELEDEVRLLRMGANLQLPIESFRSGRPRT